MAVSKQGVTSTMNLINMVSNAGNVGSGNEGLIDYRLQQGTATVLITQVQDRDKSSTKPYRSHTFPISDTTRFYVRAV